MVAASINSCALLFNIAVVVGKYYSSAPKHPKKHPFRLRIIVVRHCNKTPCMCDATAEKYKKINHNLVQIRIKEYLCTA